MQVTGSIDVSQNVTVGGGYGSTGTTISSAGVFQTDGAGTFAGNLRVGGTLSAEQFHTTIVSSSILYQSGSTKFGDSSDDIHQFTGSLHLVNSGSISGSSVSTGSFGAILADTSISGSATSTGSFGVLRTGDIILESTEARWKMVEKKEYVSLINDLTGKKYKILMEEIE